MSVPPVTGQPQHVPATGTTQASLQTACWVQKRFGNTPDSSRACPLETEEACRAAIPVEQEQQTRAPRNKSTAALGRAPWPRIPTSQGAGGLRAASPSASILGRVTSHIKKKNKEIKTKRRCSNSTPYPTAAPSGPAPSPALRHGWRGAGQRCRARRSPADSRPSRPPAAGPSPALTAPPASSSPPSPRR